jgi:tRNA-splicing ligase RtcB
MISGKALKARGWTEGRALGLAKKAAAKMLSADAGADQGQVLDLLDQVRSAADQYVDHPVLGELARTIVAAQSKLRPALDDALRDDPLAYRTWGVQGIDQSAIAQMDLALRLPISVAGALMPDAHTGYGLPIGGVLATVGAVIPYAVGSDIACRMRLSVYDVAPEVLDDAARRAQLARALADHTAFGPGAAWTGRQRAEHAVLDDPDWKATRLLESLHSRAVDQLATSGSGNHFVEWGILTLTADDPRVRVPPGRYLALLSHSGSRGVGFKIADSYTRLAEAMHPSLPKEARKLAWLPLDSEEGREYWLSMELAGRFASANHELIHRRVARAVGLTEASSVENHHNYAWRESLSLPDGSGREVIVHRKGATPAGADVLGIIPGSMADPGYLVRGRGNLPSLSSASHGAGRAMGRRAATQAISRAERDRYLKERHVTLLGGGMDESPQAYKRIQDVIAAQDDLVEILGTFQPRLVRMADESDDI